MAQVQSGAAGRGLACGALGGVVIAETLLLIFTLADGAWLAFVPAFVLGAPTGAVCGGAVSLIVLGVLQLLGPAVTSRPGLARSAAAALAGAIPLGIAFSQGWPNRLGTAVGFGLAAASSAVAAMSIPRILYGTRRPKDPRPRLPTYEQRSRPAAVVPRRRRSPAAMVSAACGWGSAAGGVCGVVVLMALDLRWLPFGLPFAIAIGALGGLIEAILVSLGLSLVGRIDHLGRTRAIAAGMAGLPWLVLLLAGNPHSAPFWRFGVSAALSASIAAALLAPRVLLEPAPIWLHDRCG